MGNFIDIVKRNSWTPLFSGVIHICWYYMSGRILYRETVEGRNKVDFQVQCLSVKGQVVFYCIRAPPRQWRYWKIHPRRPKDFPREISRVAGNLEGRGKP